MSGDVTLTDAERALGIREAACGCCSIVDMTRLREVLAARSQRPEGVTVTEAQVKAVIDAHQYMPSALRGVSKCACGLHLYGMPHDHRAHLAAVIAAEVSGGTEGVGTGAGDGATGQVTGAAWVNRSAGCPEDPAQAHPLSDACTGCICEPDTCHGAEEHGGPTICRPCLALDPEEPCLAEVSGDTEAASDGCDCAELCSMGPTCPGGMLAKLPGSGCWRTAASGDTEAGGDQ